VAEAPDRPQFFVHGARDPDGSEVIWNATKAFVEDKQGLVGVTNRRIFRLDYVHGGKHMEAQVGLEHDYARPVDYDALEEGEPDVVMVILERVDGLFLVCSYNCGVQRGDPFLVGAGEPYRVVYFAGFGPED
jgi:hypothetical protein